MKIAIIGAAGFVGTRVSENLSQDPRVQALHLVDRVASNLPESGPVRQFVGDFSESSLRDAALRDVDAVICLAAILGGAAEQNYALARKVNVTATLDLAEFYRDHAPQTRFVMASTVAAYAKPLPDPVTDDTPLGPTMVYGAQKVMMEVALSNFAVRGWLDAVSLRPSGVMARDGADKALKTAFMSRLFWCVARGEDIALPVAEDSRTWLTSVDNVAQNFIHAAMLPDLGDNRAFTLPALSLTFGELVDALRRRFPDSASQITFAPDPEIVGLFGSYPRLETKTADQLGFTRDRDAEALVASAMI